MSRKTRIKSLSIIFLSALSSENFLILLIFISDIRAQTTPVYDTDLNNEEIFSNPIKSKGLWFNGVAASLLPPSSQAVTGWECNCWNATNEFKDELECKCQGEALLRIPQKLYTSMQRLTIASAGLPVLRSTGLAIYASSLRDIVLSDLPRFESIQERAFETLKLLRTIYISHAPKLTYLSKDVFKGISETLKTIRIVNSGLVRIPDMRYLSPHSILQMIDLEGNHIERIYRKSVLIKTEQLILDNNNINFIEDSAFSGSQIAKLSFKGNRNLEEIHSNAFVGIMNIQELDLSSTSLTSLPSYGLSDLEILRVQDTHTLKTIPSIYDFKNLQVAWLTHSFHCCAFQFPSRHDPIRHAQRLKEINKWQRACSPNDSNNQSPHLTSDIRTLKRKRTTTSNQIMENSDKFYNHFEHSELSYSNSTYFKNETYDARGLSTNRDYSDDGEDDLGQFHDTADISQDNQLDALCGNVTLKKIDVSCFPVPDALNPCEDVMGSDWLRISVWIVVFLAVLGNVAVLVVILFTRSDSNSVQKFLMCHLAFADLCMGLYLLLIASIDAHSMDEYFNYAYDWQYGVGCKVAGFLTVFASHLSVFALTIITIERWLAITHALYLNKRIKIRPAAYIMAFGWMYSFIMSSFPLFGISNYSSTSICLPMEARDTFDVIYLVSIIAVNGAAFFIIAICYAQIYLSLGQETRHARNMSEMSIAKKMALLVFTNFSCWAPIAFFGLTALAGYPLINVTKSKILLVFFYPMNSCADPYLYAILTAQYRRDLYMLLSKFGLCKNKALQYRESVTLPVTNASYHVTTLQRNNSCNPSQAPHETKQMLQAEEFV